MKKITFLIMASMLALAACNNDDDKPAATEEEEALASADGVDAESETDESETDGFSQPEEGRTIAESFKDDEILPIQQQLATISILKTLAGLDEIPARFDLETFEPTIGATIDLSDPMNRALKCESIEQAEASFRSIVGVDQLITPTADGLEVNLADMPLMEDGTKLTLGRLTFHRGDGKSEMGYVAVNIPCIPNLKQIQYLPAEAFPPANAGSPYEIGDIVLVPQGTYCSGYYVCVRKPLFGGSGGLLVHLCVNDPGGDETINLDGDNEGCWYPYNQSKGMKTESGHVEAYISFLLAKRAEIDNIKYFLDGKIKGRQPSLKNKKSHIFPEGFGNDEGYVFKSSDGRGARIRYYADFGSYAWVPAYHYRYSDYWYVPNNCKSWNNVSSNRYTYVYDSDWNKHYGECWNYTMNVITFRDDSPIAGAKIEYSPTNDTVSSFVNSAKYVTQEHVGDIYASNHRIYGTVAEARGAGQTPIGVIVYVNDGSEFGNQVTELEEGYGHALVLALSNCSGDPSLKWATSEPLNEYDFDQYINRNTGARAALTDFGGLNKTISLAYGGSPAATAAINYQVTAPEPNTSKWFLPSTAQWLAILCAPGLGGMPMPEASAAFPTYIENNSRQAFNNINAKLKGSGVYTFGASKYWSSSAYNDNNGVYLTNLTYGTRLTYWSNTTAKVRPVLAF